MFFYNKRIYIYEGTKQEKEKSKEKQIILCRQNCTRLLVTLGDRNYRALIGDGLRIFIFVNETLTRNFRRILTSLSSPHPLYFHGGKRLKMKHVSLLGWYSSTIFNFQRCVDNREINVPHSVSFDKRKKKWRIYRFLCSTTRQYF